MRRILWTGGAIAAAALIAAAAVSWTLDAGASAETAADHERTAPRAMGADDAPVTLDEFSSLTCPHCARFHSETLPQIKDAYVTPGTVRYVYHDFPLDNLAMAAAMLTRCVDRDRYFGFLETLFANQSRWAGGGDPLENLEKMSRLAGMSKETFDACLGDQALLEGIRSAARQASEDHDIESTPSFLVNGEKVAGAVDFATMKRRIDEALEAAPSSADAKGGVGGAKQ